IYLVSIIRYVTNRPSPAASYNAVEITRLYWHFVDLVWIMVFTFMYLIWDGEPHGADRDARAPELHGDLLVAGRPHRARAGRDLHRAAEGRRRHPALLARAGEGLAGGDVLHAPPLRDADARARGAHAADDRDAAGAAPGVGRQPARAPVAHGAGGRGAGGAALSAGADGRGRGASGEHRTGGPARGQRRPHRPRPGPARGRAGAGP